MRPAIIELAPNDAYERQQSGALLVDVREDGERAAGMAKGATGVGRARLEADPAVWLPDPTAEILLICAAGARSLQCAGILRGLGYEHVYSVSGGTKGWQTADLPMTEPTADTDILAIRVICACRRWDWTGNADWLQPGSRSSVPAAWVHPRRCIWRPPGSATSR
jgi:rhodanese-related sulfurtransferase